MWFCFFIYDYPLECMVENSLNNYVANSFIHFDYQNVYFWEFLTIHNEWKFPIDYSLLYYLEKSNFTITGKYYQEIWYNGYFDNIFDALISESYKILDTYIYTFDYNYDLLIFKNKNYINIIFDNNYLYYLNISIYVNLLYLLIDFINYLNSYIISIIMSLSHIKNYIFYINNNTYIIDILFNSIENINYYILWVINIFYDFLNHSTYKITKVYYIYLFYIILLNIIFLWLLNKIIKINLFIYLKFIYIIENLNFFIVYLSIINIPFFINKKKLEINFNFNNFKINSNPTSTLFFMFLFLKKIKNIYIIFLILSFIKKIKIFLINILIFIIRLLLLLKNFIVYILFIFMYYINKYLLFMINNNNKTKFFYNKIYINFIILCKQININPINKFFTDKKKFKIEKFQTKEEKIYYELINKNKEEEEILFKYWKYLQNFYWNYTYIMSIKFIRIILFIILFIIKFLLFKLIKYIFKMTIITKILHILVYYICNIYIYIKLYIKHIYLKYIFYIYFKIINNIIYYFNMFIHYKLFKIITRLFLYEAHYLNSEMIDKFPYYSSKYIRNFFIWFSPINNKTGLSNKKLIKIFKLIFYYLIYTINIILHIIFIVLSYNIRFIYYIIISKTKIIKFIILNKNNIIFVLYIILIIVLFYNIIKQNNILLILFLFNIIILCLNKYLYNYNISRISNVLWYIGFYLFFIYDNIIILFKILSKIIIKLIKYIIFYPFLLFLIIFLLYNNPIIYIELIYMLKLLIIIPLIDIIFFISNTFNYYTTLCLVENTNEIIYFILFELKTIEEWIERINDLYVQWSVDAHWWWTLKRVRYNIFNYYTPFTYFWYEQWYALEEIYDIYINTIHYFKLYIQITIIYFFWSILYIMSQLSNIYKLINYLTIDEFIFSFIYTTKLIYILLLKIYIYNYMYIFIPYYIIQPILNIYLFAYELYFNIHNIMYNFNIIKEFKIMIINIYLWLNWLVLIAYNNITYLVVQKIYNIFEYIKYIILNINKYINIFNIIFMYLISDILSNINLYFILDSIYINTNLNFFFFDKYSKLMIFKDWIYSSFRFPIEYYNRINEGKYFQKYYSLIKRERMDYLVDVLSFQNSSEEVLIGRWRKITMKVLAEMIISHYDDTSPKWYQTIINSQDYTIKYIYFSYKILKFKKIFILFPYLWSIFWIYYILIYIISCFMIIKLYKMILNKEYNKNTQFYISNTYSWDILREQTIKNNYKLLKNNTNLYNYYFKQTIKNKEDFIINKKTNKSINLDIEYDSLLKNTILNKKILIKGKYKFINIYKKYIILKNKIIRIFRNEGININIINIYKNKFKPLLKLKNNYDKSYNVYNNFSKKITFDFKNLIISEKYHWLYNIIFSEKNIFNIFSAYYYNLNPYIPYVYNHYYEEPFIDGTIKLNLNENNYNYLSIKLYNLYTFYKWFDKILLNNKGSFYLFHKDPRVPYITKDCNNNKYYINSSLDYSNQFYTLFIFIAIPLIIWSTYLSSIYHFTNEMDYQFYDTFNMHLTFWLCWFMTQFSWLHQGILKLSFSFMGDSMYMFTLDNVEETILSHGDTEYHNWFNYNIRNKYIFPLYNYYNTEYYLYQIYTLGDNINPIKLLLLHLKFNLLNIYDILYVNYNLLDYYNFELIIFKIIKFIFIIILMIYVNLNNKIYKFYYLKKISINLFKFTYSLKDSYKFNIKNFLNYKGN